MSCACENKKRAGELDRIRKLAKALAVMENDNVTVYKNEDGTFGFSAGIDLSKDIVEIITPF